MGENRRLIGCYKEEHDKWVLIVGQLSLFSVHYSPQKQLHVAAFMSLFNRNCRAIRRPPPSLWINLSDCSLLPSFSSYMCELSRCEAQTLHNLPLQTGSCWWPLAAPAHAYYARGPTPLGSHLSVSVFSCSFPWIPTASSRPPENQLLSISLHSLGWSQKRGTKGDKTTGELLK